LRPTAAAEAVKIYAVLLDLKIGHPAGAFVDLAVDRHLQIADGVAAGANEVVVLGHPRFKPVVGAAGLNFLDQPLFGQNSQIAIDCPQTEVGDFGLEPGIEPVGCGVKIGFLQQGQNSLALPAAAQSDF